MSDLFHVNLAERYNQRLADKGVTSIRWRYTQPGDLSSSLVLETTIKSASKIDAR